MLLIIVYKNYNAIIQISRQIMLIKFCINKLNLRFVRVLQYLSSFNLFIYYKSSKLNIILDALSRLQFDAQLFEKIEILELLYNYSIQLYKSDLAIKALKILSKQISIYYIILIEIANKLKQRLKIVYIDNYY